MAVVVFPAQRVRVLIVGAAQVDIELEVVLVLESLQSRHWKAAPDDASYSQLEEAYGIV